MQARLAAKVVPALFLILLSCAPKAAQPSHCAQNLFCLFNQEAAASNPAGIHKYSQDLIGLMVPPEAGKTSIELLANRLAQAEQMTRTGKRKLISEANVVRAFNELMKEIGAPSSLRAEEASLRRFREHAAGINAFPALFSADRNGTNCNPGEAVFLFYLLLSGNGMLYPLNLDSSVALMQPHEQRKGEWHGIGVVRMEGPGSSASGLLSAYSAHHNRNATIALFDRLAATLSL